MSETIMTVNNSNEAPRQRDITETFGGVPVRFQVPAPNYWNGRCNRCGFDARRDGEWIVRVRGLGWWHDVCFSVVCPEFYGDDLRPVAIRLSILNELRGGTRPVAFTFESGSPRSAANTFSELSERWERAVEEAGR